MGLSPTPSQASEGDKTAAIEAVVEDFLRRYAAGENLEPQVLIAQHALLMPELGQALEKARRIAMARRRAAVASSSPPPDRTIQTNLSQLVETLPPDRQAELAPRGRSFSLAIPADFGRYRIVKLLGQGGMGAVYLAEDTELKRKVALKAPKIDPDDGPEVIERFYREARLAATLRHPHICPVYDIGQIDGVFYISMAYIEGKPLSSYVSAARPPSERSCATVVRKLASALAEAHAHGVIHRDLKPSNVMIDRKGEPVVMDFGLARRAEGNDESHRLTRAGAILGSPSYMAPEQVLNASQLGPEADIYSLGVILYELLTGKLPFGGSLSALIGQILTHDPPPPSDHRPGIDPQLEAICQRMLAKRPEARFPSMTAVAEALTEFLRKTAPSAAGLVAAEEGRVNVAVEGSLLSAPSRPPPLPQFSAAVSLTPGPHAESANRSEGDTYMISKPTLAQPAAIPAPTDDAAIVWRRRGKGSGARAKAAILRLSATTVRRRPPLWAVVAAAGLAAVVILLGAIFTLKTKDGVLTVKVMEPDVQVEIDGEERIVIDSRKVGRIELEPGTHRLVVRRGAEELYTESFLLKSGGELVLEANWRPKLSPPEPSDLSDGSDRSGTSDASSMTQWTALFNGRDLTGWRTVAGKPWRVQGGVLDDGSQEAAAYLATERQFGDFELELEYRLTPVTENDLTPESGGGILTESGEGFAVGSGALGESESGVYFRVPAEELANVASLDRNAPSREFAFLEVQLRDTRLPPQVSFLWWREKTGMYAQGLDEPHPLEPERLNGALYGLAAPEGDAPAPAGQWNRLALRAEGDRVTIRINGVKVVEEDLSEQDIRESHPDRPGLLSPRGHILLQNRDGTVAFRNIRIKELGVAHSPADASTFQNHAYKFFAEQLTWQEARARCESLGGHLVVIDSEEENAFVARRVEEAGWLDAWIGITDEAREGEWRTVNGQPLSFARWSRVGGQPNNRPPGAHYALMSNRTFGEALGWRWCDQPNRPTGHPPGFVCEWSQADVQSGAEPPSQVAVSKTSRGRTDPDLLPRGVWIPMTDELITLARSNPNVAYADGVFEMKKPYSILRLPIRAKDVKIRAKVKPDADVNACLHLRDDTQRTYVGTLRRSGHVTIGKGDPDFSFLKVDNIWPFPNDGFEEVVFSAIGDTLTIDVNGRRVSQVADAAIRDAGGVGICAIYGTAWFKDVEVQILDPRP